MTLEIDGIMALSDTPNWVWVLLAMGVIGLACLGLAIKWSDED